MALVLALWIESATTSEGGSVAVGLWIAASLCFSMLLSPESNRCYAKPWSHLDHATAIRAHLLKALKMQNVRRLRSS